MRRPRMSSALCTLRFRSSLQGPRLDAIACGASIQGGRESPEGARHGTCEAGRQEHPAGGGSGTGCGPPPAAPAITLEPRAYTPRHLVEKILAQKSALEGERKLVTVLFADVARSMELAERVD